jgi:DNA-binding NarL/FixJ family response regulator
LVPEGLSNRAIAFRLFISERIAEYQWSRSGNKLGSNARTELAA